MPSNRSNERGTRSGSRARSLASFERAQLLTSESSPYNLVVCLRVEGSLDKKRLRRALDVLQSRHPLLAARLVGPSDEATFELGEVPEIPLRAHRRAQDTSWIGRVEKELVTGFDRATGPLVRCCLLRPKSREAQCEIVLTFHHVVVDGTSAGTVIRELLESCAADAEPARGADGAPELPPAADDLFPSRSRGWSQLLTSGLFLGQEMAGELSHRWLTRARSHAPCAGPARCRVLPIAFSESETDALVRRTRRCRLTLNSALNAALLLAIVRHRYTGTDMPHHYFVFPTLRPHLDPPLPRDCVGSYLTVMRFTVRASDTRDVWDLAAEIQEQVHSGDMKGDKFLAAKFSPMSMKMILGQSRHRMGTIALSYTEPYSFELEQGALSLAGIHAFVSNFSVGPEYSAQARIFRGRLWLDIVYLDVDMEEAEAWAVAHEAQELLIGAKRPRAGRRPGTSGREPGLDPVTR